MAISEVAVGAGAQSKAIDETSAAMEHVSASIQDIATSSIEVAVQANSTSEGAKRGQSVVDKAVDQMDKVGRVTSLRQRKLLRIAKVWRVLPKSCRLQLLSTL